MNYGLTGHDDAGRFWRLLRHAQRRTKAILISLALCFLIVLSIDALPAAAGSITGTVAFSGVAEAPLPVATAALYDSGGVSALTIAITDETTGAFQFDDVEDGTYRVGLVAPCWASRLIEGVVVSGGATNMGTITLAEGSNPFGTVQFVGDFNGWNLNSTPSMAPQENCTWVDTLTLQSGTYFCKFVTDGAFDNPSDFGGDESVTLDVPGGPYATHPVSSGGTAIKMEVTLTGDYVFTLDVARQRFTAEFQGVVPQGSITGTVAFAGLTEGPYPPATITLFEAGSTNPLRSVTSDLVSRSFTLSSVPDGSYDVEVSALCFVTDKRTNITVSGSLVDLGEISLATGTSPFTSISLVGDFTGWDIEGSPALTQDPSCVWTASILLSPGEYFMKFVTDGAFGNDYGGDESVVLTLPGTYPVKAGVGGVGGALKIQVPVEDTYTFVLDERRQVFSVTGQTPVEPTSWGKLKSRY